MTRKPRVPLPARLDGPDRERLDGALDGWLRRQRWFAGKGRPRSGAEIERALAFTDPDREDGPHGWLLVVSARFGDGGAPQRYCVPLGVRGEPSRALPGDALITAADGLSWYDALGDPELVGVLTRRIAAGRRRNGITFVRERSCPNDLAAAASSSRPLGAEQSNTSVVIGERHVLKVFRRLSPGVNPDLELQRVLDRAGSRHVPRLLGAVEGRDEEPPLTFAIMQEYAAAATDGWTLALDDLDTLLTGGEPAAAAFPAEARLLGRAVAAVHADLAAGLGTDGPASGDGAGPGPELVASMTATLDEALAAMPSLASVAEPARALFRQLGSGRGSAALQRVHGDLHLGQVLKTPSGWLLTDFEGEPARPVSERVRPASPLRDVAGMLRSFDYAVRHSLRVAGVSPESDREHLALGWGWSVRQAFCEGYRERAGRDPRDTPELLRAHLLEKALYEVAYEIGNRPEWVDVPLAAVTRLLSA
ncbi:maltokinase N-terminal cap-like domain-containing protein [Actinomadura oligospora]|uniref:maltokinase N-terminal cap-like domain-containing protein n=1 Tax=Actinomadura oligospora TaxID=111804 RepID=UPI0004AEA22E|nr:phosphotransferase [Actinomadura oligospora]